MTKIEWTEKTWNPVTGCKKVSPGCKNCYALMMAKRIKGMGLPQYQNVVNGRNWTGVIEFVPEALDKPRKRKKPTTYFVNSMSDLFHPNIKSYWLNDIWRVMAETPQHTYQILTKRAELLPRRVGAMVDRYGVLPNVWIGVSVETQEYAQARIPCLGDTPATIKFLSCEPLLGPLDLEDLAYEAAGPRWAGHNRLIDWVIVGGESGPGARSMDVEWIRSLRDQCDRVAIPFFFKQWGEFNEGGNRVGKAKAGRLLDGQIWDEMPDLRLPEVI